MATTACVQNKKMEIVQALIDKGVEMEAKGADGQTALLIAGIYNNTELALALLNKGANGDEGNDEARRGAGEVWQGRRGRG